MYEWPLTKGTIQDRTWKKAMRGRRENHTWIIEEYAELINNSDDNPMALCKVGYLNIAL
jgi:hypothetical protein